MNYNKIIKIKSSLYINMASLNNIFLLLFLFVQIIFSTILEVETYNTLFIEPNGPEPFKFQTEVNDFYVDGTQYDVYL